jgi:hypothetical protein
MDEQKIIIVNLSKGKIGEDNMRLLGAMMVTKVYLAAMQRADMNPEDRKPCIMYVDEFQNFATDSFSDILSEARKYGLGLVIAHQFMAQLAETNVKDAVIGNVNTMVSFRIGVPDAKELVEEFSPVFGVEDMINLERGHIYIKMSADGVPLPPFSAICYPPRKMDAGNRELVYEHSRKLYAKERSVVEHSVEEAGGYLQKRQAEEASKAAAAALQGNQVLPNASQTQKTEQKPNTYTPQAQPVQPVRQAPVATTPVVASTPPSQPEQAPLSKVPASTPTPQPASTGESATIQPVKRPEKPLKSMGGYVYREASQKGGTKWYLGEKEAEYQAKKAAKQTPPSTQSQTEQKPTAVQIEIPTENQLDVSQLFTGGADSN